MNEVTRRASDLGVTIAAGTDGLLDGRPPVPVLHRELELTVAAGLTPMQALVSATSGAAKAVGVEARRGTIERGKTADLLVLSRNPLDDIRNTRSIEAVVHRGRIVR
jgi:imidazolonepropionase-like amidohydrolase